MTKTNAVNQKELLSKISEARKKEREKFLTEVSIYLEEARSIIEDKSPKNKKGDGI